MYTGPRRLSVGDAPFFCGRFPHANAVNLLRIWLLVPDSQPLEAGSSCSMTLRSFTSPSLRTLYRRARFAILLGQPGLIALAAVGVCCCQAPMDEAEPPVS